jgi:hypothetical protein
LPALLRWFKGRKISRFFYDLLKILVFLPDESNSVLPKTEARVLFIDMDSFFARCEQQVNYWLRKRPVGVCVYTGKFCTQNPVFIKERFGNDKLIGQRN